MCIRDREKADDLERVKRYAGAEQIDMIVRKVKEQERTEQQIRQYDRSYGTRYYPFDYLSYHQSILPIILSHKTCHTALSAVLYAPVPLPYE